MKSLVNGLATAVRRFPWVVIALTLVVSFGLGGLGGQFAPAEDQNESFAPEAAELTAATEIGARFGAVSRMQVLTSSTTGDVITLAGLEAAVALEQSIRASEAADLLVDTDNNPAILTFMAPALFAIEAGAPVPTTDAEVKALWSAGLDSVPAEFRGFLTSLVSDDADLDAATAELGLTSIVYESSDDFDELADRALIIATAVGDAPTPDTITNDAFSQELIFASGDDFQTEVARLLISAALIIVLVLAIIFLVRPSDVRDRALFIIGLVLLLAGVAVAVLPGLAQILPDAFPDAVVDAELGPIVLTSLMLYAAAFLLWTFGSPRKLRRTTADTLLTFLTIGFAIQWMNGYGFIRFEDQSQLVQILPILLIGLGVDYSIHMNTRYRQELASGRSVDASIGTAIRTVGIALVLATLTTAVGFLTNVVNDIPALAEFGELAAFGIAASFILMLTFVPSVRELLDRRAERNERLATDGLEGGDSRALPKAMGRLSILPRKAATITIVVALLFTGLGAYGMTNLSTQFSFLDFVPTTSPIRDTAVTLDERFDFPESTQVLVTGDVATGAAWNAMLESYGNAAALPDVQSVELPGGTEVSTNPQSLINVMFAFLNPGAETFDQDLFNLSLQLGFSQARTLPPDADATPLYDLAFEKYPLLMSGVLSAPNGAYDAALFTFDTTAGENGAGPLADDLNAAFAPAVEAGLDAVATSNFIISDLVVNVLRESQVSSLLLTLGAALLLLVINFWFETRRPMLGLITTIPVAMVVIWTFGLMAAFGIPFGPVTATISALGIGIGIPYMIHVTHRYLEERVTQDDENTAVRQTLTFTGGALAGSAVTTIAGFGILMISTAIPFRQFGFVIAYTILLALLAAVAVLPSMLVVWDRWHHRRGDSTFDVEAFEAAVGERP